jgi:UDP-N-acetylmuramate dehydrogenase
VSSDGITLEALEDLRQEFGGRLQEGVALAPFTSSRIGGPADFLLEVRTRDELGRAFEILWAHEAQAFVLGGGSNVLVADRGVRGVVMLNHARKVVFSEESAGPRAWAESGASLGSLARRTVDRGWAGMEWAATVPGTVGGAVFGNAGAHGGDTAGSLVLAEILQRDKGRAEWPVADLKYGYRTSWLKRHPGQAVVLSATFSLTKSSVEATRDKMKAFISHRKATQPAGASWGSMFKNPPQDFAGRLIEAAGLKGLREGDAEISHQHANFFINHGRATAEDVWRLLRTAQRKVEEAFGVRLEMEIERVGDWEEPPSLPASREAVEA